MLSFCRPKARRRLTIPASLIALPVLCTAALGQTPPHGLNKIEHIVVLYLENRGFDHLYGNFPGANGLDAIGNFAIQTDETGKPYETLPEPLDLRQKPPARYSTLP